MIKILVLAAAITLSGCASTTEFGPCVGAFDEKNPKLEYKVSARNLVVGIFFFGLIAPPVYVVVDQFFCPVGTKP